jgi:hypothetical protein
LQGFQLTADVAQGYGSLANIIVEEIFRDEAPKAPVLLYAIENSLDIDQAESPLKWDL